MAICVNATIVIRTELEIPDDYFGYGDSGCSMEGYINRNMKEYLAKMEPSVGCCVRAVEITEEGF